MQNPPNCSGRAAGLPGSSPAPMLGGRPGAQQDGPGAPQGLQPKGIDLRVARGALVPPQRGDKQKGEAMTAKPQSVHVVTSPTFARLQVLVHHRGTLQTPRSLLPAQELMLLPAGL